MSLTGYKCFLCLSDWGDHESFRIHVEDHFNSLHDRHCLFCRGKLETLDDYERHEAMHSLKCRYHDCQRYFLEKPQLKSHEQTHHSLILHPCTKCSEAFKSVQEREQHHIIRHTDRNRCRGCGVSYSPAIIDSHERRCTELQDASILVSRGDIVAHPIDPNRCFLCPFKGDSGNALKRHLRSHPETIDPGSSLERIDLLMLQITKEPIDSECPRCGVHFNTRAEAYRHMRDMHKEYTFTCIFSRCPFVADDKDLLRTHELQHKVLRKCNLCEEWVSHLEKHNLVRHLKRQICRICLTYHHKIEDHENACLILQKELLRAHESLTACPSVLPDRPLPDS